MALNAHDIGQKEITREWAGNKWQRPDTIKISYPTIVRQVSICHFALLSVSSTQVELPAVMSTLCLLLSSGNPPNSNTGVKGCMHSVQQLLKVTHFEIGMGDITQLKLHMNPVNQSASAEVKTNHRRVILSWFLIQIFTFCSYMAGFCTMHWLLGWREVHRIEPFFLRGWRGERPSWKSGGHTCRSGRAEAKRLTESDASSKLQIIHDRETRAKNHFRWGASVSALRE